MRRVSFIFGTRPEAIKLCPLVLGFRDHPSISPHVCVTGQHREMLDQVLGAFDVRPDVDLALMQRNQTLGALTSRIISALDGYLAEYQPDMVIVQGDTTTAFGGALASFYRHITVGHVEAGLRTGNKLSPFPEELNRVLIGRMTDCHFAPTQWAANNLLNEGVQSDRVFVTGNTVIDALHMALKKVRTQRPAIWQLQGLLDDSNLNQRLVLVTGHRRENFGDRFESICEAIRELSFRFADVAFVYPVHLNPNVREPVFRMLSNRPNVHLIDPLDYLPFISLMERSTLVLSDSGGIQEEAPSLGKPVLVMRDTTERPEGVQAGTVRLVGSDRRRIVENVSVLLCDRERYEEMARAANPYGDGKATKRILAICEAVLGAG